MGLESSAGLNTFLSLTHMRGETGDLVENRIQKIKAATTKEIQKIAQETFNVEPVIAQLIPA